MKYSPGGLLQQAESALDRIFPPGWNPFYSLGALSFYLFWIDAASGLYLFIFFETSINGAYESVERITHEQWYLGGIMRSIHRYSSAAMVVTVTLHLLREWILGRFRGGRWYSWVTGVPLLWLLFASGIGGYWLVWDERAQYIAITTADLFDWLPVTIDPMAFGFLTPEAVSDRFFTLMIFLHIGVPLALLLGMFIHIKKLSDARSNPVLGLGAGFMLGLVVLSLIKPALSLAPADLGRSVGSVGIDWFYLNLYPLVDILGPAAVWTFLGALTLVLFWAPWIPGRSVKARKPVIATVDTDFCNGCSWCEADCPFEAITMVPHETRKGHRQAVVIADNCVGCGICAGSCPSATPFRNVDQLKSGIDLPGDTVRELFLRTTGKVADLNTEGRVVLFGCSHGPDLGQFEDERTTSIDLSCIGQLPPSFIDYLCRREGVESVILTGCASGNCFARYGNTWLEERITDKRQPHVRHLDVRDRVSMVWTGVGGEEQVARELDHVRRGVVHE